MHRSILSEDVHFKVVYDAEMVVDALRVSCWVPCVGRAQCVLGAAAAACAVTA